MQMKQEAIISSDHATDIKLPHTDQCVYITQGGDAILVHVDYFASFLKLAQKWWDTCEVPDPC